MAREAVVHFVQESIANAVDRQKRNADKHGRANVLLISVGDLVLLSTVDLPKHVVTNVGSSKLLPKHIGSSVYYVAKAMRTRSSCLAGCVQILPLCRSSPPVPSLRGLFLGRIQLPPSRTSKRFFGSRASFSYGSVERHAGDECQPLRRERLYAFARSPIGRKQTPIGRPIKADALHPSLQGETLMSLLFVAITQIV